MTYLRPSVLILGGVLAIGVATVQVPDVPHWCDVIAAAVGGFAVASGLQDLVAEIAA